MSPYSQRTEFRPQDHSVLPDTEGPPSSTCLPPWCRSWAGNYREREPAQAVTPRLDLKSPSTRPIAPQQRSAVSDSRGDVCLRSASLLCAQRVCPECHRLECCLSHITVNWKIVDRSVLWQPVHHFPEVRWDPRLNPRVSDRVPTESASPTESEAWL